MTKDRAKAILRAYRPRTTDQEDPDVAEALRLVEGDSEMQEWLHEQEAFHRSASAELRGLPVPKGLKEAILDQQRTKVVVPMWQRPAFLAAAACVALALILSGLWLHQPTEDETFTGFQHRMIGFLRVYRMDIVTNDLVQVRQFLAAKGAPADYSLTPELQKTPVKGGARLSWQGHPVAMLCFDLPNRQTLWLFVLNQSDIEQGTRPGLTPLVETSHGGITTASWSREGKIYLMAVEKDSDALQNLLRAKQAG